MSIVIICEQARCMELKNELVAAGLNEGAKITAHAGLFDVSSAVRWVGMPPCPGSRILTLAAPVDGTDIKPGWTEYSHGDTRESLGWNYSRDLVAFSVDT